MSKSLLLLLLFRQSPEHKVLLPPRPEVGLGQSVASADPPPPLGLVVTDSEGLTTWLVLGVDIAAGSVAPSVTTGIHSPLDDMAPVCGGVPNTQLATQINRWTVRLRGRFSQFAVQSLT